MNACDSASGGDYDEMKLVRVPAARLIGIGDIAVLLGVKRPTVDLWRVRDRKGRTQVLPMPKPLLPRPGDVTDTPLWDRDEVLQWAAATGRLKEGPALRVVPPGIADLEEVERDERFALDLERPVEAPRGLPPGRRGREVQVFLDVVRTGARDGARVTWDDLVAAYSRELGIADNRAPQRAQTWLEARGLACVDWSAEGGERIVLGCPLVNPAPAVVADLLRERIRATLWSAADRVSRRDVTQLLTCTYTAATQGLEHLRDHVRPLVDEPLVGTVAGGGKGRWVWALTPTGIEYARGARIIAPAD